MYELILQGIRKNFPADVVSEMFDESDNLRHANVILAARKSFDMNQQYDLTRCGWYRQFSAEHAQDLLYAMLNPNDIGDSDYLEKIIQEKKLFLQASDSIRVGFFKPGFGEEIVYSFMKIAQEQGKQLIFENLGVVPDAISRSLAQLGATEFKPLIFGYMKFIGDDNAFWAEHIENNSFACFSTQDTVTLRGWWEGREKWAKQKFYLKQDKAKVALLHWLFENRYLSENAEIDLRTLTPDLHKAVLASVADCAAREVVFTMPDIVGSGDEGIINMPGTGVFGLPDLRPLSKIPRQKHRNY
ncbi:MAG: 4-alpha-glucanotransferase [Desulfobacteraceae bacterium]|nr:4-alpha-glucanotransferase [Desulfobacteraceae bacterium]